jgi:magnesium-protoporphyrin IX monomethyl ester (oxidative) cyclase
MSTSPVVCLVSMPYFGIERPSIALGILKACLERSGISSTALYANIWFAADIGLRDYESILRGPNEMMLAEWTFAESAFPEKVENSYLAHVTDMARRQSGDAVAQRQADAMRAVRAQAGRFVDRMADHVLSLGPQIVGCSSVFQQNTASLALLRRIRALDPAVVTLMGGANCEGTMGKAIVDSFPWVDYVVSGEAEDVIVELCLAALEHGSDIPAALLPYGTMTRGVRPDRDDGARVPRAIFHHLDDAPTPDYDDYFAALGASKLDRWVRPGLLVETSRGCWWGQKHHCTFCGLNGHGMTFRSKSPERVLREFDVLTSRYGLRKLEVVDNILDMSHIRTVLAPVAQAQPGYELMYETKANLSYDQLAILAAAGVRWIQPGIESLHDRVLKLMDKGTTACINIGLLKAARTLGIRVIWNMLHDFPGEEDAWYAEMAGWLPLVTHLQPPTGMTPIRFDRFSPYHERQEMFGVHLEHNRAYDYVYPLAPERLDDLAYFFQDGRTEARRMLSPLLPRPGVAAVERCVGEWCRLWQAVRFPSVPDPSEPPVLQRVDEGRDRMRVLDTRPCAVEHEVALEGLAASVYSACDRPQSLRSLTEALETSNRLKGRRDDLTRVVDDLIARKLMVLMNGRLLALATVGRPPALPRVQEFPGGFIDVAAYDVECGAGATPITASA